jgi:hypothetical protein
MTAENKRIPDWARQERQGDLDWIRENADVFHLAAKIAFQDAGRGAIVVDTTVQPIPGGGHPFGYFDQEFVKEELDEDTKRMVQEYDPDQELILVLLKEENRTSSYRIRSRPAGA